MTIFGDLERFLSEDLYPYRYPLTIGLVIAIAGGLAVAYRLNWHLVAWRNKVITGITAAIIVPVAIVGGNYFLSPLWERSVVCETSPIAGAGTGSEKCEGDSAVAATQGPTAGPTNAPSATPDGSRATPSFEVSVIRQGEFEGADDFHFGKGTALLIETGPGTYTLRFEDFSVRNGPDLFVFLSTTEDGSREGALNLGALKGTDGAFNYEVPGGTDVSQYKSVIVYCEPFDVLFAVAALGGAP